MTLISIIGLPRSGTTLLGRTLSATPHATYLEEPNPIWRFRNWRKLDHEQFQPEHATQKVRDYIRRFLFPENAELVIEKTPANCLRTGFVERVAPEARIIFITRKTEDIQRSILKKWLEGVDSNAARLNDDIKMRDLRGKFAKFHYVHPSETPLYIWAEIAMRWTVARRGHTDFWGPQFQGWQNLRGLPPKEVAHAITEQMDQILQDGIRMCAVPHSVISYEGLVADPSNVLQKAMQDIGCGDIDLSASLSAFYKSKQS